MKKIGISVYPDFDSVDKIKEELDLAKSLGYQVVFTSLELGDLGFENTKVGINDNFLYLFNYCAEIGMEIHADVNDHMLEFIGASFDNLKPISDLKIKVLRLDSGFTHEEVAVMTKNSYGIIIEDNASMCQFPQARIDTVVNQGNIQQYYACHNFFPLNETGLSYNDALISTKRFQSYGIKVGIFIGSLYSTQDLNNVGSSIVTIEDHRYIPAHIQAMELFVHNEYDYVIFGDSHPSVSELKRVSEVAQNDSIDVIKSKYNLEYVDGENIESLYCVEIPVWLNADLDKDIKEKILNMVFLSRADQPELMVRGTASRDVCSCKPYNTILRNAYSLVIDNELANRYNGELQISLVDLPAVRYANVIGQVKPYGYRLVEHIKYANVLFVLRED